jgi:RNA polymerase sigma-70 factor (ECF subfamily)
MTSDWDYLERARTGDESAWRTLIERHSLQLVTMVFLITGSMATAQDLAQETFIHLYRNRAKHREGSFKSYLTTIAYHMALKAKKRSQLHQNLDDTNPIDQKPNPLEEILRKEQDRQVAQAIQSLEPQHRDILVFRFYGNHSYREIADITNIPIGTVKSRLFYAVKSCQHALRQKGILE